MDEKPKPETSKTRKAKVRKSKKKRKATVKKAKTGKDVARAEIAPDPPIDVQAEIVKILNYGRVKDPAKRPPGRPSKYIPEVHATALEALMADGYSFEASCGAIGIDQDTGQAWAKDENKPEFSEAKKRGEALSQLWWEHKGKKGMDFGKDFNATVWVFSMKNRFGWRDAKDVNLGGQKDNPLNAQGPLGDLWDELNGLSDKELDQRVGELIEKRRRKK